MIIVIFFRHGCPEENRDRYFPVVSKFFSEVQTNGNQCAQETMKEAFGYAKTNFEEEVHIHKQ